MRELMTKQRREEWERLEEMGMAERKREWRKKVPSDGERGGGKGEKNSKRIKQE